MFLVWIYIYQTIKSKYCIFVIQIHFAFKFLPMDIPVYSKVVIRIIIQIQLRYFSINFCCYRIFIQPMPFCFSC